MCVTYEECYQLKEAPTIKYMMSHIQDVVLFLKLNMLNNRYSYKEIEHVINVLIKKKVFKKYK